jgi:hypothetical protein
VTPAAVCTGCSFFDPLDADAYTAVILTTSPTQPLLPTAPNGANSPAAALNRRVRHSLVQTEYHPLAGGDDEED